VIGFIFIRKQRISGNVPNEISEEDQRELDTLLKRNTK